MGLYDIFDDIAKQEVMKTETGDKRIFGIVIGYVVNNYDKTQQGRVLVDLPSLDKDASQLRWAKVISLSGGKEWGTYFLPEIGDAVAVAFERGNIDCPVVIGCMNLDGTKFIKKAVDEDNQIKAIQTKHGSRLEFFDHKEGDGEKDRIEMHTPEEALSFKLDNEKKEIYLGDKDNANMLQIRQEKGVISIKAEKRLEIEVGDGVSMTMNGSNGTVTIKAKKFVVQTDNSIQLEANGSATLSGSNTRVAGNSKTTLESSGATIIGGQTIKLG